MQAICGIIGKRDNAAVKAMANALKHRGHSIRLIEGDDFTVASSQPDLPKNATAPNGFLCLLDGSPLLPDTGLASPAAFQKHCAALKAPAQLNVKGAFAAAVRVGKAWWLVRDHLASSHCTMPMPRDASFSHQSSKPFLLPAAFHAI